MAHLRRGGVGQFAPPMTDIDVPQSREAVDVFPAVRIAKHGALALDDDQRPPVIVGMVQRVNQIAPIGFDQLGSAVHVVLLKPVSLAGTLTAPPSPRQPRRWPEVVLRSSLL